MRYLPGEYMLNESGLSLLDIDVILPIESAAAQNAAALNTLAVIVYQDGNGLMAEFEAMPLPLPLNRAQRRKQARNGQ